MKADEVAVALTRRWPEDRYLHIPEATFNPWRQGTKIDVAVISCWKSLGWEIDAVEVKVSLSDFKREIERYYWTVEDKVNITGQPVRHHSRDRAVSAATVRFDDEGRWIEDPPVRKITRHSEPCTHKSEPWREIAHRFWIACPAELAVKIEPLLPAGEGWGLLAVDGRGCTAVVKPVKNREPRMLEWSEMIGLLRCATDASERIRGRAFDKGARAGYVKAQNDLRPDEPVVPFEVHNPSGSRFWSGRPGRGIE